MWLDKRMTSHALLYKHLTGQLAALVGTEARPAQIMQTVPLQSLQLTHDPRIPLIALPDQFLGAIQASLRLEGPSVTGPRPFLFHIGHRPTLLANMALSTLPTCNKIPPLCELYQPCI